MLPEQTSTFLPVLFVGFFLRDKSAKLLDLLRCLCHILFHNELQQQLSNLNWDEKTLGKSKILLNQIYLSDSKVVDACIFHLKKQTEVFEDPKMSQKCLKMGSM